MKDIVEKYRVELTNDQLDVLDKIWRLHKDSETHDWPSRRAVHLPNPARAQAAINALPAGTCLLQIGPQRYELTLLGVLLTRDGPVLERLFVEYLDFMRRRLLDQHDLKELLGSDIERSIGIDPTWVPSLRGVINVASSLAGSCSHGPDWRAYVADNVDFLVPENDLRAYVCQWAVEHAARIAANHPKLTPGSTNTAESAETPLSFVSDATLRKRLAADRDELLRVSKVNAWKSSVILAGGILEGMLLDALAHRVDSTIPREESTLGESGMDRWGLAQLVEEARRLNILPPGSIHLSHALREYRNLVHPGRQLRLQVEITRKEAEIAIRAVDVCLDQLASRSKPNPVA